MSIAFRLQGAARRAGPNWAGYTMRAQLSRCYSRTTPRLNDNLPLAGIRVLDMTRVLAGVRGYSSIGAILTNEVTQ